MEKQERKSRTLDLALHTYLREGIAHLPGYDTQPTDPYHHIAYLENHGLKPS